MRNLVRSCALLVFLAAFLGGCGVPEPVGSTESALTTTYSVGNGGSVIDSNFPNLGDMWMSADMPYAPLNPSAYSAFSFWYNIDNGGTVQLLTWHGTLNSLQFRVDMVEAGPVNTYYNLTVSGWTTDGNNNVTFHSNYLTSTALQRQIVYFGWSFGQLEIYVTDSLGNVVSDARAPWTFGAGTQPMRVYSPQVAFSSDPNAPADGHNRCLDLPAYDDGGVAGHLNLRAYYGANSPTNRAQMVAPLSAPICAISASNFSGETLVTWDGE